MDLDAELAELAREMILESARVRLPRPSHRTTRGAIAGPPIREPETEGVIPPDPRGALDTD